MLRIVKENAGLILRRLVDSLIAASKTARWWRRQYYQFFWRGLPG